MGLIFTDRSRYITGLSDCMMARYLGYHYKNTGVSSKGFSIPLVTGSQTHRAVELILTDLMHIPANMGAPDLDPLIRSSIATALREYEEKVNSCDLSSFPEAASNINDIVSEQTFLLEGLVWCWAIQLLPWIVAGFDIYAVEQEFEKILSCTCSLTNIVPNIDEHHKLGCEGVVLMTRPDIILRKKSTKKLVYVELKTGSDVQGTRFAERFEENIQFILGGVAVEHNTGEEIEEFYVHGLHKGYRGKTDDGGREQKSILLYPYVRDAVPPMIPQDISPEYYKIQSDGSKWGCTKNRGYDKIPIWKLDIDRHSAMSVMEHYVKNIMTPDQRSSVVKLIGPIPNSKFLTARVTKEMIAEESRWADRIYFINEEVNKHGDWDAPEVEEFILDLIPRSWNCKKYGEDYACTFIPKCHEHGVRNLLTSGRFERRDPNHPIEKDLSDAFKDYRR